MKSKRLCNKATIMSEKCSDNDTFSTSARLIAACIQNWSTLPSDLLSVRSVAALAGASPSAVDYHFGSLEHLLVQAQQAALREAQAWLSQRIAQLQPLADTHLPLDHQITVIAAVMDDWAEQQRPLAWAAMEAASYARYLGEREAHATWLGLWRNGWGSIAPLIGLPHMGEALFLFHQGEGPQHLLRGNRAIDAMLLREDIGILLAPHDLGVAHRGAVRMAYAAGAALHTATRARGGPHGAGAAPSERGDEARGAVADAVQSAAAAILCENGLAALNYRAVAARAGCTLGQVSWVFKSKTKLLEGAFLRLYADMALAPRPAERIPAALLFNEMIAAVASGQQPLLAALHDIISHIARHDDHAALRAPFRVFSDPAAQWVMASLLDIADDQAQSLSPVLASLCRGADYLALGSPDIVGLKALATDTITLWLNQCAHNETARCE